jgi:hypothetical protein
MAAQTLGARIMQTTRRQSVQGDSGARSCQMMRKEDLDLGQLHGQVTNEIVEFVP